jgi:hypothetical protein
MISDTKTAYGSQVFRQGRSRAFWLYQAKRSSFTVASLDEPAAVERPSSYPSGSVLICVT